MSNFKLIAAGVETDGVLAQLQAMPEAWNANTYRTATPGSPHKDVSDIWLRWRSYDELSSTKAHREPHFPAFWPAWALLPSLHQIVRNLSHVVSATYTGAILVTRTPPGGSVKPHIDKGWSAQFYDTKLYLVLQSNAKCLNYCGGEVENFRAGDVWQYPNNILHSVENNGETDHINVIICFRTMAHEMAQEHADSQITGPATTD